MAAGGELAIHFGITRGKKAMFPQQLVNILKIGWSIGGNVQILEEKKIIDKIQFFFEMHGNSRFTDWHDNVVKAYNRAGFKKTEDDRIKYYVWKRSLKMKSVKELTGSKQPKT
ncbi:hypothetical protein [Candidatus Protochlamydia amoebophila]|uniref:hypothetical protein n=1 Tax=Candidatus Protochlamydia amoebophila TaxID=362787 RepID=UPI001BC9CF65|nr:hypothetical protein [Candidatus Protochlamydia amoebophila]